MAASSVTRLKEHIEKCVSSTSVTVIGSDDETSIQGTNSASTSQPNNDTMRMKNNSRSGDTCFTAWPKRTQESTRDDVSTDKNPKKSKTSVRAFADTMSLTEQNTATKLLARMIAGANLPFSLLDNTEFKEFVHHLRPSYRIPDRHAFSHTYIPQQYDEVHNEITRYINNAEVLCLVSDGWCNIRGDAIVGHVVTTPKPVFWSSINISNECHTGEFIASKLEEVLIALNPERVAAIVVDNASNMKSACTILGNKYPWLMFLGCLCHVSNLICKDACNIESLKTTLQSCKEIVTYIKDHYFVKSVFQTHQVFVGTTTGLKQCVLTRWGSAFDCVASISTNHKALVQCAIDDKLRGKMPDNLKNLLLSDEFWLKCTFFRDVLSPLVAMIHDFESDTSCISIAYQKLMNIKTHFSNCGDISKELETIFDSKWHHVNTNLLMLANLLDPKLRGSQVPSICMTGIRTYVCVITPNAEDKVTIISQLAHYIAKTGGFSDDIIWQQAQSGLPAFTWWKAFATFSPNLSRLAIKVLSVPCSSASIERIWSRYGAVHSKARNRLTDENSNRLVYLNANMEMLRCKGVRVSSSATL